MVCAPERCVFYTTEIVEALNTTGSPDFGTKDGEGFSYLAEVITIDDRINSNSLARASWPFQSLINN